ncbi:MAG: dihydropteroate synthase [Verrucomicrobia bacterium]|nr:dihydropteroate synthase [Verrucomicrobiota bacterium]
MGIVNINADSFSGDGTLDPAAAFEHARRLHAAGADIIDVGGESARTNRGPISEEEEIQRVLPFLERFRAEYGPLTSDVLPDDGPLPQPVLSINTWRPAVAEATLAAGGELLNDLSALPEATNAAIAARHRAALLVMHSIGAPKVPHTHVRHDDILATLDDFFAAKLALAETAGLSREAVVLDPGLDFAKQRDDNLAILRHCERLHRFGRPVLLPISRKTVIGDVLGLPQPTERDPGTIACLAAGFRQGMHIYRVHHVAAAAAAVRALRAVWVG